jgi:4-hydroxyphenylpyruvate dioxygenase-like putative hemolysin
MSAAPELHHVVFCVEPENQDAAADVWRVLGFEFTETILDDVTLRVLLDWSGGIEIISPTSDDPKVCAARSFLDEHGEGVYSVVLRSDSINAEIEKLVSRGATPTYRQRRGGDNYSLEEAMFAPTFGMSITLLETDLPG